MQKYVKLLIKTLFFCIFALSFSKKYKYATVFKILYTHFPCLFLN